MLSLPASVPRSMVLPVGSAATANNAIVITSGDQLDMLAYRTRADVRAKDAAAHTKNWIPLVVFVFHSPHCGACTQYMRDYAPRFHDKYKGAIFAYVDVNQQHLHPKIQRHTIKATPTFMIVQNGQEAQRLEGFSAEALGTAIVKHLSRTPPQ